MKIELERRQLGQHLGPHPGPTLIAVAGIHGNEPAGVLAARRVFARLAEGDIQLHGEFIAFAGNVEALRQGIRYQSKDLNRQWNQTRVHEVRVQDPETLDAEDKEQLQILEEIEAVLARACGQVHLCDFHSSSASGIPFVLFGDTLAQRRFVRVFPIPIIMGLEEQVDGVMSEYWTRRGCITFACEGGQHDDPSSVDALEAVLWLSLSEAGLLAGAAATEVAKSNALLEHRRGGLPRVMEVVSRRAISLEDGFRMEPGFRNIDHARRDQLLARDRQGDIRAPTDGLVILPLYQGLGSDGFFWGRAVSEARMKASEILRHLGVDRLLGLLPGVERDPANPARFIVDTQIARLYPLDIFHLLGYRRVRERGHQFTVERQAG